MILNRRQCLEICARLAAALHVLAVALVLVLPIGHAAWAIEGGRSDVVVSVQTDVDENVFDGEPGLVCCGHASCHLQAGVVLIPCVVPRAQTAQQVLRPVEDDEGASLARHPPRKPPRLA